MLLNSVCTGHDRTAAALPCAGCGVVCADDSGRRRQFFGIERFPFVVDILTAAGFHMAVDEGDVRFSGMADFEVMGDEK